MEFMIFKIASTTNSGETLLFQPKTSTILQTDPKSHESDKTFNFLIIKCLPSYKFKKNTLNHLKSRKTLYISLI